MGHEPGRHRVPFRQLLAGLAAVQMDADVAADDARLVAAHLVEGSARGYRHHGVERIFQILAALERGTLDPRARPLEAHRTPASVTLDARHGLGVPAAHRAVAELVPLARRNGVAFAGVRNGSHLGVLAPFAESIAEHGMIGLVASTTEPGVVLPGGRGRVLGTNPIAFAFPLRDGLSSVDFSTAAMTRGDLLDRLERGESLPEGVAVGRDGTPTTDAAEALDGGILPFGGGVKGTLISLLVAVLAGPAVGAPGNHRITGTRSTSAPSTKGDLFLALDLSAGTSVEHFTAEMEDFFAAARAGGGRFHVPGSTSAARRERALAQGIRVSDRLLRLLGDRSA